MESKLPTMLGFVLMAFAAFFVTGCATTVRLPVYVDAQIPQTQNYRTMAVLDFQGPGASGSVAASAVVNELAKEPFFVLVDQSVLAKGVATERSSKTDDRKNTVDSALLEAARREGVDVILTGQVVSYAAHGDIEHKDNEQRKPDPTVTLTFRLIDVGTGQVRGSRTVSHSSIITDIEQIQTTEVGLAFLMQQCAHDIASFVSPHRDEIEVSLATKSWGSGMSDILRGNSAAAKGDWDTAKYHWEAALKKNPMNDAALHNLGVAHEARFEYNSARQFYDEAMNINKNSPYARAAKRVSDRGRTYIAIMERKHGRPLRGQSISSMRDENSQYQRSSFLQDSSSARR